MASKKKSLDQAQKEKIKRKKNSDTKRKKYYAGTILESDFDEVKKQFPYIERDSKGIYYIDRAGERKEIKFPYIPLLDDDSCKMIVLRKKTDQGEFVFQIIDNIDCITNILENNGKKPIAWHIAPNRKVTDIKKRRGT